MKGTRPQKPFEDKIIEVVIELKTADNLIGYGCFETPESLLAFHREMLSHPVAARGLLENFELLFKRGGVGLRLTGKDDFEFKCNPPLTKAERQTADDAYVNSEVDKLSPPPPPPNLTWSEHISKTGGRRRPPIDVDPGVLISDKDSDFPLPTNDTKPDFFARLFSRFLSFFGGGI